MEAVNQIYMNGTSSSGSYRRFGQRDGIGIGAKLYVISVINDPSFGLVLLTRIRVRSAPFVLEKPKDEAEESNVVSLKRVKAKAEADHRTIWGDIDWEKIREGYASVFVDRKAPIGLQQDMAAFLAKTSPEAEAKVAAEYLLSLVPEAYRTLTVDELAEEFFDAYRHVFTGLKATVVAAKVTTEVEKENLGSFHMSTVALKKLQTEMKAAGVVPPDHLAEDIDQEDASDSAADDIDDDHD